MFSKIGFCKFIYYITRIDNVMAKNTIHFDYWAIFKMSRGFRDIVKFFLELIYCKCITTVKYKSFICNVSFDYFA